MLVIAALVFALHCRCEADFLPARHADDALHAKHKDRGELHER